MTPSQPKSETCPIRIGGEEYPDLAAAAKSRGVALSVVKRRLGRGKCLEEALTPAEHGRRKPVTVHGIPYPSIRSACLALGLPYGTYEDRRRHGLTLEQALERPVKANRGTSVIAQGVTYPSIRAAAEALRLSPGTLRKRLFSGLELEPSNGRARKHAMPAGKSVTVAGVTYPSYTRACVALGLSYNTFVARRRKGWSETEALTRDRASTLRGKPVTLQGVTYASLTAARAVHGVSAVCYYQRLRMGWSIEEAMGFVPHPSRNRRRTKYEVGGKTFSTLKEAALGFDLPLATVMSRLSRGQSLGQALGVEPPPPRAKRGPRKQSPRFNDEDGVFYISGREYCWK